MANEGADARRRRVKTQKATTKGMNTNLFPVSIPFSDQLAFALVPMVSTACSPGPGFYPGNSIFRAPGFTLGSGLLFRVDDLVT